MLLIPGFRKRSTRLGRRIIGDGKATYVIAEVGINHNGSLEIARQLIDGAADAGCDCVKFQKRTPELCVPPEQRALERDTPWGRMTYLDYRRRVEFGRREYEQIDRHCRQRGIEWTASCWDEPSVEFVATFEVPFFKAASASLTDLSLLKKMRTAARPLMLSTGMSTVAEIRAAVKSVGMQNLLIAHSTSAYPCPPHELNLRVIGTLRKMFPGIPVGYSGHEAETMPSAIAVALGATFVERHITLDRSMWGSDQAASLDLAALHRLVKEIRLVESALGSGVKQVYDSELGALKRLRRVFPSGPAEFKLVASR